MTNASRRVRLGRLMTALTGVIALASACDEPAPQAGPRADPAKSVATALAAPPAAVASVQAQPDPGKRQLPQQKLADCPTTGAIQFENPKVESAVRLKAQKPTGPITRADLARLRSLNITDAKLERLDLCLFHPMKALRELFLGPGEIVDLEPIAGATKLESLRASLNPIRDLEPLAKMTAMDRLDLAHTEVADLRPLASMTSLTELLLDSTPVSDIAPLAKLEKLEVLVLKNTRVKDLSPLRGLKSLKSLDVRGAPIEDTMVVARPGLRITED